MGRAFQVRAASMASTAAKKSALNMRASKEIFMVAKSGGTDPNSNLALRAALDKYRAMGATKDVMERAIKKAEGDDAFAYIPGRYEVMGPGGSQLVIDTLTDNVNRAISNIKAVLKKTDSILQTVAYNFTETGIFLFAGNNLEEITETLILNDVDVWDINEEDDVIEVLVNPTSYGKTRDTLYSLGIKEFNISEIQMIPNDKVTLNAEDTEVFKRIIDMLEDVQDVQEVYHNVNVPTEE